MTIANTETSLLNAMYAMSLAKAVPDAELLDEFTRTYPEHAEALTDFAVELALDALLNGGDEEVMPANVDTMSATVARVMSEFENRLHERKKRAASPQARAATAAVTNPFARLDRSRFRGLAEKLDINTTFLSKIRDRSIDPTDFPGAYIHHLADEMPEEVEVMTAHIFAPAEAVGARTQMFKADGKPGIVARQTFEEAVRTSGLSDQQQQRLLSFRD